MPTAVIVVLSVLFGLGAALVFLGITRGDWVPLLIGAVVVGLALRMRRQVKERLAQMDQESSSATDQTTSPGTARPDGAGSPPGAELGDVADVAEEAAAEVGEPLVGEDGLALCEGEAATVADDEGLALHGSGLGLRDAGTGEAIEARRLRLGRDGAQVVRVFTSDDELDDLQADELAPGVALALVPQRSREGRVEGVRVFDEAIDHLAGWLPDDVVARVSPQLRGGGLRAHAFYEWRDDAATRRALEVLVHRADVVDLGDRGS